jgi:hypothetical protein
VIFRGKFRGISWKNDFSKLFPRKIQFFSQHFWGKIFRGIFPGKNVQKIGPWSPWLMAGLPDCSWSKKPKRGKYTKLP